MRLRLNPDYKYRMIAGIQYLIPCAETAVKSKTPIRLTETAAWIWEQLEKGMDSEEIIVCMPQEFDVDMKTSRKAVTDFCQLLLRHRMAVEAGKPH